MPPREQLERLERLARNLGLVVRYDSFETTLGERGGTCLLRGEKTCVLDSSLSVGEKILRLAEAIAPYNIEAIFLPPNLRDLIRRRRIAQREANNALGN